jgi:hypothetical protein
MFASSERNFFRALEDQSPGHFGEQFGLEQAYGVSKCRYLSTQAFPRAISREFKSITRRGRVQATCLDVSHTCFAARPNNPFKKLDQQQNSLKVLYSSVNIRA